MSRDIRINVARARSSAVGREHGIAPAELGDLDARLGDAHTHLTAARKKGGCAFYDLYKDRKTIREVRETAAQFHDYGHENLVILGIGGSALGTTALATALLPPYYNLLPLEERRGRPRLFVMDNIDPDSFHAMLRLCPPERTLFNVISKSGTTAETVAQLLIVEGLLAEALGSKGLRRHLVVTGGGSARRGPEDLLGHVAEEHGLKRFPIPEGVGGRFSVFSAVGLFPAALLGMDLGAFTAGCKAMDRRCARPDLRRNPAYLRAAFHYLAWCFKHKPIAVMMSYADALEDVASWYRQLWAESLGKRTLDAKGKGAAAVGQTPIKALGATDQHSQLQLYLEGPNDKIITTLKVGRFRSTLSIPSPPPGPAGLGYLEGSTMNGLIASECRATVDALHEAKRPVIQITLPRVNEYTVAQLLYMLEVETAMAGTLFHVNPFDQPAVERIKVLTREYMGGTR